MLCDKGKGEARYTGLKVEPCDRTEVDSESPAAGGWLIEGFVDHTAASRSSILGTLVAGDIILQIDGEPVLRNIPTKMASSRILFDDNDDSMTLLVYSPSKEVFLWFKTPRKQKENKKKTKRKQQKENKKKNKENQRKRETAAPPHI